MITCPVKGKQPIEHKTISSLGSIQFINNNFHETMTNKIHNFMQYVYKPVI